MTDEEALLECEKHLCCHFTRSEDKVQLWGEM